MNKPIVFETKIEERLESYLSRFFHVYRQQWSECMKKRIDIVLVHKKESWLKIGVEVKNNGCKHGKDLGAWCLQASDYNNYIFCNKKEGFSYGKMPIIVYPTISGELMEYIDPNGHHHNKYHDHHNINSFLFKGFSIGEIRRHRPAERELLKISINNRTIWKEFYFGRGNETELTNKEGYDAIMKQLEKEAV